jgi:PAS domain S-box-containing protein
MTVISFLIGLVLLVGLLTKWVGNPIAQLTAAIKDIQAKGVMDKEALVNIESGDEIGELAAAFNQMTLKLHRTTMSKAQVDYILENMLNSLVIIDRDHTIQSVNRETLNILGYEKEELEGKAFGLILDQNRDSKEPAWDNGTVKAVELNYRSKAGKAVPVLFSSSPLTAKNGESQGRICVAQNMTEIKVLRGLIPICATCKKIRDDKGFWNQVEAYINEHSQVEFSHSICPECTAKYYPDLEFEEED